MRAARWVLSLVVSGACCSCDRDGLPAGAIDLGTGGVIDLSASVPRPDLARGPDLAIEGPVDLAYEPFCAGTPVAGTCVQRFFAPVARCFRPAGACTYSVMGYMIYTICWASGAREELTGMGYPMAARWTQGGGACLGLSLSVDSLYDHDGQQLRVSGGDVICPDGSRLAGFAPNLSSCPALSALLSLRPPDGCTYGDCK